MEVKALDSIDLTIKKGEFCGIIGRNGAGKSTLLKIIAGQLTPTAGMQQVFGRKALLQLGRGFDPELTGRENISNSLRLTFMDPSIPEDIVAEIVEFSELGEFINFPIKTYSSGMYSRLAFATAISVKPDILIADEILAVGDINFSQKCLSKMHEFKEDGKTVILVTHDLNAVRIFCDRAILLEKGKIARDGEPQKVCEEFRNIMLYGQSLDQTKKGSSHPSHASLEALPKDEQWQRPRKETFVSVSGGGEVKAYRIRSANAALHESTILVGSMTQFELLFSLDDPSRFSSAGFTMHDDRGQIVLHLNSGFDAFKFGRREDSGGLLGLCFRFQMPHLRSGQYSFSYSINTIGDGGETEILSFKHDFDFSIEITHGDNPRLARQSALVLTDNFSVYEIQ
jgi:ABC-type polysaccharide/polyol phosphate transport system ATPase subunit